MQIGHRAGQTGPTGPRTKGLKASTGTPRLQGPIARRVGARHDRSPGCWAGRCEQRPAAVRQRGGPPWRRRAHRRVRRLRGQTGSAGSIPPHRRTSESAPAAHSGKTQNSGAHAARCRAVSIRYPTLACEVCRTGSGRNRTPSASKGPIAADTPSSAARRRICGVNSACSSLTSQASNDWPGSAEPPPSSITRWPAQATSSPAGR